MNNVALLYEIKSIGQVLLDAVGIHKHEVLVRIELFDSNCKIAATSQGTDFPLTMNPDFFYIISSATLEIRSVTNIAEGSMLALLYTVDPNSRSTEAKILYPET